MNEVERWLEPRLAGTPDALRERILQAVKQSAVHASPFTLHDRLRELGREVLAQAVAMPPSRDAAVTLLAADALMTFACEAMAEEAPERLGELR